MVCLFGNQDIIRKEMRILKPYKITIIIFGYKRFQLLFTVVSLFSPWQPYKKYEGALLRLLHPHNGV